MHRIRSLLIRGLNVFRRSRLENDLSDQLTAHRDMIEADLIRRGVSPQDAARAARKAVGNDLLLRELSLDEMGYRLVDELRRDIRYAVRGLIWNPRLTIIAVLSFALGIGANVAIFSSVDQMLFRPLPYDDPGSLFVMQAHRVEDNQAIGTLPERYVVEARRGHRGFVDLGMADSPTTIRYDSTSDPGDEPALALLPVTFNTLRVLGVSPMMGRDFREDDARQKRPLCLVTHEAWKAMLDSDPAVIGRGLWRERQRCEIVGVLPPEFLAPPIALGRGADGLALSFNLMDSAEADDRSFPPYVRLKPGVSIAAAQAELNAIADRVKTELPRSPGARDTVLRLTPIRRAIFGPFSSYSWLVAGAAVLVLVLTCANIACLLLVRAQSREHLAAVRVALGASPIRLVRSAVLESLTLAAAGSLVALLVLAWSGDALRLSLPPVFSRYAASVFDLRVLAFALFAACGSAVASIVLPSFRLWRIDVVSALQGTGGSNGPRRLLGGRSLLVIEAAIGMVLVAGAAATSRSLVGLLRTDLGFDPEELYQVTVSFPEAPDSESRFVRYYRSLDVIRGLPGVRSAAGANVLPTSGAVGWTGFGEGYEGHRWHVSNEYFETLRQPVLAGRAISAGDVAGRLRVAVLSLSGLRQLWPDTSPTEAVGRVLRFPGDEPIEVIGVVSDFRSAYAQTPMPALYMPITPDMMRYMMYAARMEDGRVPPVRDVRERIRREIGEPSSVGVSAVTDRIDVTLRTPTFQAALFGLFGVIALASAAVGLYGVCSFEVALRRREMGVRLALGGSRRDLQHMVVAHAIRPALIGVAAGLLFAYWAAKFLQSFLHQVDARDPWTLALVATVLILTASAAAWLPARRASRLSPADILRAM